jgi:LmbE family N-acetylglucosaminyl deacetylase
MIAGWKRVLVLAPHTDDGEFGAGGTLGTICDGAVMHAVLGRIRAPGHRSDAARRMTTSTMPLSLAPVVCSRSHSPAAASSNRRLTRAAERLTEEEARALLKGLNLLVESFERSQGEPA